jgi:hypothetical protein
MGHLYWMLLEMVSWLCFHRPGKRTKSGIVTCRHCGVAIEECLCVDIWSRSVDPNCYCCGGSMWVAIVRGRLAKIQEAFTLFS